MLKVVQGTSLSPPYPEDTKANGFRVELDLERIKQSRTWLLADKDVRPWLLMLWVEAWESIPVGTFEDDDAYIAARIGCKLEWFQGHREQLLRGWTRHADGRLYHSVITEQVQEMLWRRKSATERQRRSREQRSESHVSHAVSHVTSIKEQEQEQDISTNSSSLSSAEVSADLANCPHKDIVDLYHKHLPNNPRVRSWQGQRQVNLRARWREHPDLEWWDGFLQFAGESAFLTGRTDGRSGPFYATLEWIVKSSNFQKINDGNYHRRQQ